MVREKKLQISVVTLLLLCIGLCITSAAISYTIIKIENNTFQTGEIKIDLNGGKPIIHADSGVFQPGMTLTEDFTITNKGGWKVYYKLYFDKVDGKLGDVLHIRIYKKDAPEVELMSGNIKELMDTDSLRIAGELESGETQHLCASFYFPPEAGEEYKGETLKFDMAAIAVQTKNNPEGKFN